MPIFIVTPSAFQMDRKSSFAFFMVSKQAFLYFPILCLARASWMFASFCQVSCIVVPCSRISRLTFYFFIVFSKIAREYFAWPRFVMD